LRAWLRRRLQGPNVIGGYPDPQAPAQLVSEAEHSKRGYGAPKEKEWFGEGGAKPHAEAGAHGAKPAHH